jgi:hypothetical protein
MDVTKGSLHAYEDGEYACEDGVEEKKNSNENAHEDGTWKGQTLDLSTHEIQSNAPQHNVYCGHYGW